MRCLKNTILKVLAVANIVSFVITGFMIDSQSWLLFAICYVNVAWLGTFSYANNWFNKRKRRYR